MTFGARWLVLICLLSFPAAAATIHIGYVSFDQFIPGAPGFPGVNAFSIANLTGDETLGGYALPPDFPVYTPLVFLGSSLTLTLEGGTNQIFPLGDLAMGAHMPPVLEFPETALFSQARFTAQVNPTTFSLDDGSAWTVISATIDVQLMPSTGTALEPGLDPVLLTVDANPQTTPIPEPTTWSCVLLALLLLGLRGIHSCRKSVCGGAGN